MNATVSPTENTLSDSDLLDGWVRDQHAPALAELVQRYSRMVLSVCRRRCRSESDADDAYQTTFLYLASNAGKLRNPECLPGWLHRVAQRASTATLHNKHSQVEPMVQPPEIPDDPLEKLTQRHQAIVLDEELAELPEDYRAAIVMHVYEGLSVQSLADQLETTTGAIRGRLQRAKKLLARRLRRRGIAPVVAFAAASTWSVTETQSITAAETFRSEITDAGLPDSPIDISLLDSLLAQGVHAMPTFTTTGILGTTALVAALMMTTGTHGQSENEKKVVSLPAASVESDVQFQLGGGDDSETQMGSQPTLAQGFGGGGNKKRGPSTMWVQRAQVPEPDSLVAKNVSKRLDQPAGELSMEGLLSSSEIPVFVDERALSEAGVDLAETVIEFTGPDMPMRSALRKMLQPHALQAVVDNDGLVVTADFAVLASRGLPMSRWVDADQAKQEEFERALYQETTFEFDDTPLIKVIEEISEAHNIQIVVDGKALEEIGLSEEEPITLKLKNVSLRSFLRLMLRVHDLTYMTQDDVLAITTIEKAEQNLLNRIYWLEGTGFAPSDMDSVMELIETSIFPETWEALGGPSSMMPLNMARPAILVSSTMYVHEQVERLMQVCREGHFGPTPEMTNVEVPVSPNMQGDGRASGGGGQF